MMADVTRLFRKGFIVVNTPVIIPYEEFVEAEEHDFSCHPPQPGVLEEAPGVLLKLTDAHIRFACASEEESEALKKEFDDIIKRNKFTVIEGNK